MSDDKDDPSRGWLTHDMVQYLAEHVQQIADCLDELQDAENDLERAEAKKSLAGALDEVGKWTVTLTARLVKDGILDPNRLKP